MSEVIAKEQGGVVTITINRPDKKNALTLAMYDQMASAIAAASESDSCKVVLLEAEGDVFTAGNDLGVFAQSEGSEHLAEVVSFMNALMDCPLPVVAKVQGKAIGIGTTMLLHCDLVYASDNALFSMPFVNLALVPEYASSFLLPKLAGHRKASEWLLLGEPFDALEAAHFGLINRAMPVDVLSAFVSEQIEKLVKKPRLALLQSKRLMRPDQDSVKAHMNEELDIFIEQLHSEAAKEAFAAFAEKRAPDQSKFA